MSLDTGFGLAGREASKALGVLTILEAFERHVARAPNKDAIVFLGDGVNETDRISYAALQARAFGVADSLLRKDLVGRPVLLLYPTGIEFLVALIGCFRAGAIAVPAPFPVPSRAWERIGAIARDARPAAILSTRDLADTQHKAGVAADIAAVDWIATDAVEAHAMLDTPSPTAESVALVQYSSGSTSAPKGVAITHANLAHNEAMLATVLGHGPHSVGVNWVPAYHDMGLIGGLLQTVYCGATSIILPPLHVLQRPHLWLEAISRYRGNTSTAPTFAYEFCVRRIPAEKRAALDLSSWDVAICGAEPVRADVLEEFAAAFAIAGFSPLAFVPAYGLAEATLMTTAVPKGTGLRICEVDAARLERNEVAPAAADRVKRLVSCGITHLDQEVAIVDPASRRRLGSNCVGEIWVSGGSVGQGYWQRAAETEEAFHARLADDDGKRYLRTGDLGFLTAAGLFVTGRIKEMLIVRGSNYYPQDIEQAVRTSHAGLETGEGCAFGIDAAGEEAVVLVFEPARSEARQLDPRAVAEAAIVALSRNFGLRLHDFVLVRPGALPRTTSGKLQRGRCRELYLSDALPVLGARVDHPALGRLRHDRAVSPAP